MRFSGVISRAALVRSVCSCSLALLVSAAWAGHFRDLERRLDRAPTPQAKIEAVLSDSDAVSDPDIGDELDSVDKAKTASAKAALATRLTAMVGLRALAERPDAAGNANSGARAKDIKASVLYRDQGVVEQGNWLAEALKRLRNIHFPEPNSNLRTPSFKIGAWVIDVLWALLAGAILILIYLGVRQIDFKNRRARRTRAVLEEDEPEQSVDEWLATADRLAAEGRYREAVRALYLACLLRFDEYRVARFDRHETNWEHLRRIQGSPRRPAGLDFTSATKAFDRIWYGEETDGPPDVERFRAWYGEYLSLLRGALP